jgi:hypothetical protein
MILVELLNLTFERKLAAARVSNVKFAPLDSHCNRIGLACPNSECNDVYLHTPQIFPLAARPLLASQLA